jgi:hypothetical protein
MARLRRCELCHQDRYEPLFWVYPKGCPECPDPTEFPQRYTPTVRQFENSPKYAACRQAESRSIFSLLARSG